MIHRLLVLSAGFGEGHHAAARALAAAWGELHGPGTAVVADAFDLAAPRINALVRRSYLGLINRLPGLWRAMYHRLDRSRLFPAVVRQCRAEPRVMLQLIARHQPCAICCTYPVYGFWLESLARRGRIEVPYFNVVTDSISINSLWWRAGGAGWFVPNEDSAEVLRGAGVHPRQVHVLGFPVNPSFAELGPAIAPPPLAGGHPPRILHLINSGTRGAMDTARRLLAEPAWDITCTTGRNDGLREPLVRLARERARPAAILGWTEEMPRLLLSHHVVISKAGGATTQEALAARCPMIVSQIVPGQEEGNYELLRRHGIGALAESPAAVVRELERAFSAGGAVLNRWRAALEPLARPHAAHDIALRVRELVRGVERSATRLPPACGAGAISR